MFLSLSFSKNWMQFPRRRQQSGSGIIEPNNKIKLQKNNSFVVQLAIIFSALKFLFLKLKDAIVLIYCKSSIVMGNILFLLSNINDIDLKKSGRLDYIHNYRQFLRIINRNDKEALEMFIKSFCKNNEINDLCLSFNLFDSLKRPILIYVASNSGN